MAKAKPKAAPPDPGDPELGELKVWCITVKGEYVRASDSTRTVAKWLTAEGFDRWYTAKEWAELERRLRREATAKRGGAA